VKHAGRRSPSAIGSLAALAVIAALAYALTAKSITSVLIAVATAHVVVLLSRSGPGVGVMLLTTGRFIYFAALLLILHLEGDSTYTAVYFCLVDCLVLLGLLRSRHGWRIHFADSKLLLVSFTVFVISAVFSWVDSGYGPDGLYWLGTLLVFGLLPLSITLLLREDQLFGIARWTFWSVFVLAAIFAFEAATDQVSWFEGRASLDIADVPQIGGLFIGSVIPLGLFAVTLLGRELLTAAGLRVRPISLLLRWSLATLFLAMLVFTGQRSPLLALILSAGLFLFFLPNLGRKQRLGMLLGASALFTALNLVPNAGRYSLLFNLATGDSGALSADESASMRLEYYNLSWDTFLSSPLTGSGLGTFYGISSRSTAFPDRIPHDAYLEIAAGQGLLGAVPMGILLAATGWIGFGQLRRNGVRRDLHSRLVALFVLSWAYELALIGMTGSVFADSIFWVSTGAIWVLSPRRVEASAQFRRAAGTAPGSTREALGEAPAHC
jgi:O-antigen ligase